jgi:hypothetical protein
MTFYDSSSKSVHREVTSKDKIKMTGMMLSSMLRDSDASIKLEKKGSKNLRALIHEKRRMFKERKENGHSLYHGVTLDRETLKPKKTMCLSLHQDG